MTLVRISSLVKRALHVAAAVAPRAELLDDPGREAGWGVVQPDGRGLRLGAVHGRVGAFRCAPGRRLRQPAAFLGCEVGRVAGVDRYAGVGAVDGHDPVRVVEPEVAAHVAAEVAARGAEAVVAERRHEVRPQPGDLPRVRCRAGRAVGVAVARQARDDDVECVGGVAAVRAGVGEQRDHLQVAPERVRPAVGEHQREGGSGRRDGAGVDGVDRQAAELDPDLGERGQRRLLRRPVEAVGPVGDELAQVVEVGAERPVRIIGRIGPARPTQPGAEVLERGGRRARRERLDGRHGGHAKARHRHDRAAAGAGVDHVPPGRGCPDRGSCRGAPGGYPQTSWATCTTNRSLSTS